jgi:hypothetical protein
MNVIFAVLLVRADWEQISTFIRIREGMEDPEEKVLEKEQSIGDD